MVARLRHRGPSGEATWDDGECALGIARLAIVAPNQPARVLDNERGDILCVVNGELYNHQSLLQDLRKRGHVIVDGPDTALLPQLYEERGENFPEALDGMFAVAIWDRRSRTLTLARDRAGEKPLFVAHAEGRFAFASEPGALVALPWVSRAPSAASLARYLVHGFFAGSDAAYAALRQLPPGHTLTLSNGVERLRRYWRPWDTLHSRRPSATPENAAQRTGEALASAVLSRVPGEVPFGVFLSGGVDSGMVATLAARGLGHSFPTFSMRIEHRGYDESGFAKRVAQSIGAQHHEVVMSAREGEEALQEWAVYMDQPLGDPSVLPTWALARYASRYVPVVLTGEGGDELFGGYPTYLGHRYAGIANRVPGAVASAAVALARRFRPKHHHVTMAHLLERFLGVRGLSAFERHLAWFGTTRGPEALALLAPELRAATDTEAPLSHARELERAISSLQLLGKNGSASLTAYQLLDFETYLSGDLLTKVDRCTMAHGVESRAPFLRPALIEFALALPEAVQAAWNEWQACAQAGRSLTPARRFAGAPQAGIFAPVFGLGARSVARDRVRNALPRACASRRGTGCGSDHARAR